MKFIKKFLSEIVFIVTIIICIIFSVCSITMLQEYSDELSNQAGVKALLYTTENSSHLKETLDYFRNLAQIGAEKLAGGNATSVESFGVDIRLLQQDERFDNVLFARYYKDGVEYTMGGDPYSYAEDPSVVKAVESGKASFVGFFTDKQYNYNVVAFCAPVSSPYADSIVLYYAPDVMYSFEDEISKESVETSEFSLLSASSGEVIAIFHQADLGIAEHNNIYDILRDKINDKSVIDDMQAIVTSGGTASYQVEIDGDDCVLSVYCEGENDSSFSIVSLYNCRTVYESGYRTVTTIMSIQAILFAFMVLLSMYFIISRRNTNKRILHMHDNDDRVNCMTRVKFERLANDIVQRNRSTSFAVVVVEIKHYRYLTSNYSEKDVTDILLALKRIIDNGMQIDEIFGYLGEGKYSLLIHYREMEQLQSRLMTIEYLLRSYSGNLPVNYHLGIRGGIYLLSTGITKVIPQMIDFAVEAKDELNVLEDFGPYRIYNELLQEKHKQREYIEIHMQSALDNNNFVVFYQPKVGLANGRPDSAEALVRWYNPEINEYMSPGLYIPIFEQNGFITKVDRYIFEQVCVFIQECAVQGRFICPISVNVSRVTALQNDFVDYYTSIKNKYKIGDGFISIEFTESFAFENYEGLRNIISTLHKNGFKCSIDDFGTGYSSYNLLKEIQMDEIKLDRFFIERGESAEKDLKILSSVISLGKVLGMKVTQEGVETEDQMQTIRKLGCQVVQGYYYSKPLGEGDFVTFIEKQNGNGEEENK